MRVSVEVTEINPGELFPVDQSKGPELFWTGTKLFLRSHTNGMGWLTVPLQAANPLPMTEPPAPLQGTVETLSAPCALLDQDFILKLLAVVQKPEIVKEIVK